MDFGANGYLGSRLTRACSHATRGSDRPLTPRTAPRRRRSDMLTARFASEIITAVSIVLPERLQDRVQTFPETHGGVHTVTITLVDGKVFSPVEVASTYEVIRVLGYYEPPFTTEEIAAVDDASGLA